jgi:hypothetical protein
MHAKEILAELKSLGSPSIKKVLVNHGIQEPFFGVKVADLKKIEKRVKTNYQLALDLFDTGNYDAMYLAALIADDAKMTKEDLQRWAAQAYCPALASSPVAWVASGSPHGYEAALEWIDSKDEMIAVAGWSTLGSVASVTPDDKLDIAKLKTLVARVQKTIHTAPNELRSAMNKFVIMIGSYVAPLTDLAIQAGEKIGKIAVDVGDTSCEAPFSPDYIRKVQKRGSIGKKRKSAKC